MEIKKSGPDDLQKAAGAMNIQLPKGLGLMADSQDLDKRFRLAMENSSEGLLLRRIR